MTEWGFGEAIGQGMDLVFGDLKRESYPKPKLLDNGASFIFTMMAKDVKKALGIRAAAPRLRLNERQERALGLAGGAWYSPHGKTQPWEQFGELDRMVGGGTMNTNDYAQLLDGIKARVRSTGKPIGVASSSLGALKSTATDPGSIS